MKNIVLIGMPGVGKSSTGVVIAKILGFQFLDADLLIQSKYGDILEHLIEKYGIEGFIKIEKEVNMSQTAVSYQLKSLRQSRLVKYERRGQKLDR